MDGLHSNHVFTQKCQRSEHAKPIAPTINTNIARSLQTLQPSNSSTTTQEPHKMSLYRASFLIDVHSSYPEEQTHYILSLLLYLKVNYHLTTWGYRFFDSVKGGVYDFPMTVWNTFQFLPRKLEVGCLATANEEDGYFYAFKQDLHSHSSAPEQFSASSFASKVNNLAEALAAAHEDFEGAGLLSGNSGTRYTGGKCANHKVTIFIVSHSTTFMNHSLHNQRINSGQGLLNGVFSPSSQRRKEASSIKMHRHSQPSKIDLFSTFREVFHTRLKGKRPLLFWIDTYDVNSMTEVSDCVEKCSTDTDTDTDTDIFKKLQSMSRLDALLKSTYFGGIVPLRGMIISSDTCAMNLNQMYDAFIGCKIDDALRSASTPRHGTNRVPFSVDLDNSQYTVTHSNIQRRTVWHGDIVMIRQDKSTSQILLPSWRFPQKPQLHATSSPRFGPTIDVLGQVWIIPCHKTNRSIQTKPSTFHRSEPQTPRMFIKAFISMATAMQVPMHLQNNYFVLSSHVSSASALNRYKSKLQQKPEDCYVNEPMVSGVDNLSYFLAATARVAVVEFSVHESQCLLPKMAVSPSTESCAKRQIDKSMQVRHGLLFPWTVGCALLRSITNAELSNFICQSPLISTCIYGNVAVVDDDDDDDHDDHDDDDDDPSEPITYKRINHILDTKKSIHLLGTSHNTDEILEKEDASLQSWQSDPRTMSSSSIYDSQTDIGTYCCTQVVPPGTGLICLCSKVDLDSKKSMNLINSRHADDDDSNVVRISLDEEWDVQRLCQLAILNDFHYDSRIASEENSSDDNVSHDQPTGEVLNFKQQSPPSQQQMNLVICNQQLPIAVSETKMQPCNGSQAENHNVIRDVRVAICNDAALYSNDKISDATGVTMDLTVQQALAQFMSKNSSMTLQDFALACRRAITNAISLKSCDMAAESEAIKIKAGTTTASSLVRSRHIVRQFRRLIKPVQYLLIESNKTALQKIDANVEDVANQEQSQVHRLLTAQVLLRLELACFAPQVPCQKVEVGIRVLKPTRNQSRRTKKKKKNVNLSVTAADYDQYSMLFEEASNSVQECVIGRALDGETSGIVQITQNVYDENTQELAPQHGRSKSQRKRKNVKLTKCLRLALNYSNLSGSHIKLRLRPSVQLSPRLAAKPGKSAPPIILQVQDMDSTNGTWVNGKRLRHSHGWMPLSQGDTLELDDLKVVVSSVTDPDDSNAKSTLTSAAEGQNLLKSRDRLRGRQPMLVKLNEKVIRNSGDNFDSNLFVHKRSDLQTLLEFSSLLLPSRKIVENFMRNLYSCYAHHIPKVMNWCYKVVDLVPAMSSIQCVSSDKAGQYGSASSAVPLSTLSQDTHSRSSPKTKACSHDGDTATSHNIDGVVSISSSFCSNLPLSSTLSSSASSSFSNAQTNSLNSYVLSDENVNSTPKICKNTIDVRHVKSGTISSSATQNLLSASACPLPSKTIQIPRQKQEQQRKHQIQQQQKLQRESGSVNRINANRNIKNLSTDPLTKVRGTSRFGNRHAFLHRRSVPISQKNIHKTQNASSTRNESMTLSEALMSTKMTARRARLPNDSSVIVLETQDHRLGSFSHRREEAQTTSVGIRRPNYYEADRGENIYRYKPSYESPVKRRSQEIIPATPCMDRIRSKRSKNDRSMIIVDTPEPPSYSHYEYNMHEGSVLPTSKTTAATTLKAPYSKRRPIDDKKLSQFESPVSKQASAHTNFNSSVLASATPENDNVPGTPGIELSKFENVTSKKINTADYIIPNVSPVSTAQSQGHDTETGPMENVLVEREELGFKELLRHTYNLGAGPAVITDTPQKHSRSII